MTLDKRFAIIDRAGIARYPYVGATGAAKGLFTLRSGSDSNGTRKSTYVKTIEEVVRGAVIDGYRLRVKAPGESGGGSLSLHAAQQAAGYMIAPELEHLVASAALQPMGLLPPQSSTMTAASPIEEAKEFVLKRVQEPALNSPDLAKKIKAQVKHSDIWLRQFKRIGDLYAYLRRFSQDKEDTVYLEMKKRGLSTFEDVTGEFAERFAPWLGDRTRASDFVIGQEYSAHEVLIFSGSYDTRAGGMFVIESEGTPRYVVIKATLSGGKYANSWLEQGRRLKYFFKSISQGEKQVFGEHFQANAAILKNRDIPILTFVRPSDTGPFKFHGAFIYASHHVETDGSKWFELVRNREQRDVPADAEFLADEFNTLVEKSLSDSAPERQKRLKKSPKKPAKILVQTYAYARNPDVVAEVLARAAGHCERCKVPGPFLSRATGKPYLEVHHKITLANGGDDTVENAIALCPNCHRQSHYG